MEEENIGADQVDNDSPEEQQMQTLDDETSYRYANLSMIEGLTYSGDGEKEVLWKETGVKPVDGENPQIYSKIIAVPPNSFAD
jgi:hypothetical protein